MANGHHNYRVFPIKGYPGYELEVDDERLTVTIWNSNRTQFNKDGKRRKMTQTRKGPYWAVWLIKPGAKRGQSIPVHDIVCKTIYGEPKEYKTRKGAARKQEVCHGRLGQLNNHPSNLRWGTRQENSQDMVEDGVVARGERHGMSKLTDALVRDVKRRVLHGESRKLIAKELNLNYETVNRVIRGESWGHVN